MGRVNRFGLVLSFAILFSLLPAGFAPLPGPANAQGAPEIRLNGSSRLTTKVGATVQFTLTGYPANSWVLIQNLGPNSPPARLTNALTDANGNSAGTIQIPQAPGGRDNHIEARSGSVRDTAVYLVVAGSFADLPAWGNPAFPNGVWQQHENPTYLNVASGNNVRFHISGLDPEVLYKLTRWENDQPAGTPLQSMMPTEFGFTGTQNQITESGTYVLTDDEDELVTTIAVITVVGGAVPAIANLLPSSASPDELVHLFMSGFLASWTPEYSWDGVSWISMGGVTTNAQGAADFHILVPDLVGGERTLYVRIQGVTSTVEFNVLTSLTNYRTSTFEFWSAVRGLSGPAEFSYFEGGQWVSLGTITPDEDGVAIVSYSINLVDTTTIPVRVQQNGETILVEPALIMFPGPLPPVASIEGGNRTVQSAVGGTATVTLDGSDSYDLDWGITGWQWEHDFGSGYAVIGTSPTVELELAAGVHDFRLTVTDADSLTSQAIVTITVTSEVDPDAELSTSRATVSSVVAFEVVGFPGSADVTATLLRSGFPDQSLAALDTDGEGTAHGSFVVPATPGGEYTVRFTSGTTVVDQPFEVAPRITPTPGTAAPGQTISLNLRGFAPNDDVLIRWKIGSSFFTVGSARTSGTGSLTNKQIVVPTNATAGPNTIRVQGEINQQSNAVTVIVPTASISPTRTTVNNWVSYTLTDFPANSQVAITWTRLTGSTIDMGTVMTDAVGAATGSIRVPATPGGAGQQITFSSGAVSKTVLFEVAPRVKVTPAEVTAGANMNISLRGFARQEAITIRWRAGSSGPWTTIGSGTTSNTGSANLIITVPVNEVNGSHQLRAETASFNAQTSAVSVTGGVASNLADESTPVPTEDATPEVTPEPPVTETPSPAETPTAEPEPSETPTDVPTETPDPTSEPTATPTPTDDGTPESGEDAG